MLEKWAKIKFEKSNSNFHLPFRKGIKRDAQEYMFIWRRPSWISDEESSLKIFYAYLESRQYIVYMYARDVRATNRVATRTIAPPFQFTCAPSLRLFLSMINWRTSRPGSSSKSCPFAANSLSPFLSPFSSRGRKLREETFSTAFINAPSIRFATKVR